MHYYSCIGDLFEKNPIFSFYFFLLFNFRNITKSIFVLINFINSVIALEKMWVAKRRCGKFFDFVFLKKVKSPATKGYAIFVIIYIKLLNFVWLNIIKRFFWRYYALFHCPELPNTLKKKKIKRKRKRKKLWCLQKIIIKIKRLRFKGRRKRKKNFLSKNQQNRMRLII